MKVVIWDWNGTLINDFDLCYDIMNYQLKKRNLNLLTKSEYRSLFDFPVKDFYVKTGFRFENETFADVGNEFFAIYEKKLPEVQLHDGVVELLDFLSKNEVKQYILSARQKDKLIHDVKAKGIKRYFDIIQGIDSHEADSKISAGQKLIEQIGYTDGVIMIGDTTHDYEVAQTLGVESVLIAAGHQTRHKLANATTKALIFDNLREYLEYLQERRLSE